uniref:Uncharacterized protein n=1 Tax=Oryza rufipogon TaxID=4529 RepID=A0A0E0QTY7_ORYRU
MLCENAKLPIPPMAHLRLIAAVACATAAAAAPTMLAALAAAQPANALSLPTWAVHVSSVAEWYCYYPT